MTEAERIKAERESNIYRQRRFKFEARMAAERAASRERYRALRETRSRQQANARARDMYRKTLDELLGEAV